MVVSGGSGGSDDGDDDDVVDVVETAWCGEEAAAVMSFNNTPETSLSNKSCMASRGSSIRMEERQSVDVYSSTARGLLLIDDWVWTAMVKRMLSDCQVSMPISKLKIIRRGFILWRLHFRILSMLCSGSLDMYHFEIIPPRMTYMEVRADQLYPEGGGPVDELVEVVEDWLVPHLVTSENKRIEMYIYGLDPQIHEMMATMEPTTIQSVILKAGVLTDEAIRNGSLRKNTEKRGNSREPSKDGNVKDDNKRSRTGRAFATTTNPFRKEYTRYFAKDCRAGPRIVNPLNAKNVTAASGACFEYGGQGHGNNGNPARGRTFVDGVSEEAHQDPNIMTGTFTLNNHYATTLFDSGADYSFVFTTFIPLLDIELSNLGFSYEIKIARAFSSDNQVRDGTGVVQEQGEIVCHEKDYKGKGGVIAYTCWTEKMESVQDMSGCGDNQKVKYTTDSFIDFKALMRDEFYLNNEMKKLETEFWCHAMVRASHATYTDRFHELARLVPYLVTPKKKRIEKYIYGLAPQIHGIVATTEPTTIQSAILKARVLIDEAIRNGSLKKNTEKRGNGGEPSRDGNVKDDNKRSKTGRVFATTTNPVRKEYTGAAPKCTNCNFHHNPKTPYRMCTNYNRLGHFAKDCRAGPRMVNPLNPSNLTAARGAYFECGGTNHYKAA
ncbi:reverse transcriptase domain-containing protein [Tanacetum coccineum]